MCLHDDAPNNNELSERELNLLEVKNKNELSSLNLTRDGVLLTTEELTDLLGEYCECHCCDKHEDSNNIDLEYSVHHDMSVKPMMEDYNFSL